MYNWVCLTKNRLGVTMCWSNPSKEGWWPHHCLEEEGLEFEVSSSPFVRTGMCSEKLYNWPLYLMCRQILYLSQIHFSIWDKYICQIKTINRQYSEQLYIELTPEFEVVWGPFVSDPWAPNWAERSWECCFTELGNVQLNDYLCCWYPPLLRPIRAIQCGVGLYKYDHYLVRAGSWLQARIADSARKQFSSPRMICFY